MHSFFQTSYDGLVESPNGPRIWWHSMPLPDGSRISGEKLDKDMQFKMWDAMQIANDGGLSGKHVLDIGANDGFFSIAALMAGAASVTSIDSAWTTWPHNIEFASAAWGVCPQIITGDFRTYPFERRYDTIFLLGVLYHVQDVYSCMALMAQLLKPRGTLFLETQMSQIESDLPIFECASELYPTVARQGKEALSLVGISNYLFPNEHAIRALAYSYNFHLESLEGPSNLYTKESPSRRIYSLESWPHRLVPV